MTTIEEYWTKAKTFAQAGKWFELKIGSPTLPDWAAYFQVTCGRVPWGLKLLENRRIEVFLVPCERPEWFDVGYMPPRWVPHWPPFESRDLPSPESCERVSAMHNEVRNLLTVKSMQDVDLEKRQAEARERQREREFQRIQEMNKAVGVVTPEGSIPVSPMLRKLIQGEPVKQEASHAE